jgi:paraquat-inducible protein B
MRIRFNPLLLGAFILGAIALAIVALLTVASGNLFQKTGHFVFYLAGSAQGLDKGTAVSLNGVRIGQIDQVGVLYDRQKQQSLVRVLCQVDRSRLSEPNGTPIQLTDNQVLQHLVSEGLRAQVQTAGVVGAKFVELGFYNPREYPPPSTQPRSAYPVVPTVPSTMTEVTEAASQILGNLRQTDFAGIARQVKEVLGTVDRQVGELETNRLTDHLSAAADSLNHLTASTNLQGAVAGIQGAAASLNDLLTNLNTKVAPLSSQLEATLAQSKTTLASVSQSAQEVQDFVALRNQLGEETRDLVKQLTQTARTIERLAGFLERHPKSLLTGREQPPSAQ